jgi:hypothetical protein
MPSKRNQAGNKFVHSYREDGVRSILRLLMMWTGFVPRLYRVDDAAKPGLAISEWLMYYLDDCGSVDEAVARTKADGFQLRMASEPSSGRVGAK